MREVQEFDGRYDEFWDALRPGLALISRFLTNAHILEWYIPRYAPANDDLKKQLESL